MSESPSPAVCHVLRLGSDDSTDEGVGNTAKRPKLQSIASPKKRIEIMPEFAGRNLGKPTATQDEKGRNGIVLIWNKLHCNIAASREAVKGNLGVGPVSSSAPPSGRIFALREANRAAGRAILASAAAAEAKIGTAQGYCEPLGAAGAAWRLER